MDSRDRSQIAYLANALANYPESRERLLQIARKEADGSEPVLAVVTRLEGEQGALGDVAKRLLAEDDAAIRYAGQALLGSLGSHARLVAEVERLRAENGALREEMTQRSREFIDNCNKLTSAFESNLDRLRAENEVRTGEWCANNRAEGKGSCGMCPLCCKELRDENEKLRVENERLKRLRDAAKRRVQWDVLAPLALTADEEKEFWADVEALDEAVFAVLGEGEQ